MHRPKDTPPDLRAGLYDLVKQGEDGELQGQPVYLFAPNKKRLANELGGWFVMWQEASMQLAREKSLTLTDWRVLAVLQAKLDFDNWIRISQSEIGREIDVAQPHVSASMKRLLDLKVVLPGPATRGVRTYRLNPEVLFRGSMRNAVKARRETPRLTVVEGGRKQPELPLNPGG